MIKTVLENACVTVPTGHLAAIIGPNGAGNPHFKGHFKSAS